MFSGCATQPTTEKLGQHILCGHCYAGIEPLILQHSPALRRPQTTMFTMEEVAPARPTPYIHRTVCVLCLCVVFCGTCHAYGYICLWCRFGQSWHFLPFSVWIVTSGAAAMRAWGPNAIGLFEYMVVCVQVWLGRTEAGSGKSRTKQTGGWPRHKACVSTSSWA